MSALKPTVVVATSNPGKAREFAELLPPGVEILSLRDIGASSPEETGATFLENAALKALAASGQTEHVVIADDSGIVVHALDGAPGLYSARYAGEGASDRDNREKLHRELAAISAGDRTAHYEAAIVVAHNNTIIASSIGRVDGSVTANERGENGFGYDRLFELTDGRTMAEVERAEKTQISHRAQAVRQVLPTLLEAIGLSN